MMETFHIYIHIGLGKTGTTAIQKTLTTNHSLLLKKGFFYVGRVFEHLGNDMLNPMDYYKLLLDMSDTEALSNLNENFEHCFRYCNNLQIHNILWSWEALANNLVNISEKLKIVLQPHYAKIIVYLRRQDKWIESAYYQWGVKHKTNEGPVLTFDAFLNRKLENGILDYYETILPWAKAFGKENIIVRLYEQEQLREGIFVDFFQTLGLQLDSEFKLPENPVYQSFNHDVSEMIKIYNSIFKENHYPNELDDLLQRSLSECELKKPFDSFELLSPQQRLEIVKQFEPSNQKIARDYLGREDGRLFYEPLPELNEGFLKQQPQLTVETVVRIFMQIMTFQYKMITDHLCAFSQLHNDYYQSQESLMKLSYNFIRHRRITYFALAILLLWLSFITIFLLYFI